LHDLQVSKVIYTWNIWLQLSINNVVIVDTGMDYISGYKVHKFYEPIWNWPGLVRMSVWNWPITSYYVDISLNLSPTLCKIDAMVN
jgi:hypothetical protein